MWCALAVGSYRTLWWLLPFQRTDLLIVLSLILSALMVTMVALGFLCGIRCGVYSSPAAR